MNTKKIFLSLAIVVLMSQLTHGQITQRSSGYSYLGIGYSLVGFTDPVASDIYPFLDFRNGNFMTDINFFFGHRPIEEFAFEISPSLIFTSGIDKPGFNYTENGVTKYHIPRDVSLFMIPINVNGKYFPFSKSPSPIISTSYLTLGGGMSYIREEYTNFIYSVNQNNTPGNYERTQIYRETKWVPNFNIGLGLMSTGVFGYGVELNYRFVLTDPDNATPLAISRAANFNSFNITLKGVFIF